MVAGPGFEPGMLRAYETGVVATLPAIKKQDAFFEYGLKAVALPLSESAKRQMLESNQRVINDVAASILKLVEAEGIEPF